MIGDWVSINDRLPISGPSDKRYESPFHEEPVHCLVDGFEVACNFWACWEETRLDDAENFIMEFDCKGKPTHWRHP